MPKSKLPPVHIVGAGGIGCAVGYALRACDVPVTFVDADAGKVEWGCRHGVQVDARTALPAHFVYFDDWQPAVDALVLLCTKCYDNRAVLDRLPVGTHVFPIQNGFDSELSGLPAEGIASFVSECLPGKTHTRLTRRGKLQVGLRGANTTFEHILLGEVGELPRALAALGIRFERVGDILPYKYTKLMYNAAISPLAASAGIDNGQLLSVKPLRRLFFDLIRENYAILHGAGIALGKVGPFHPATVQRILSTPLVAHVMAWAFYPGLRGTYCSMAPDLPKGKTEIEYYNRHLIDVAGARPCPLNRRVYELVKRMEREREQPGLHVLEELTVEPADPATR